MANAQEEYDKKAMKAISNNVEKHGCFIGMLEADNYMPALAYSIGLFKKFKQPEIICFGMNEDVLTGVINHARDLARQGAVLEAGKNYGSFLEGYDVQFLEVNKDYYPYYFGYAGMFYNNSYDFPALQLVWPDEQKTYPWEEDFNPKLKFKQPLLDRDMDFKFYEERNTAVYTTREVVDGKPILFVHHNEDGDWQFLTAKGAAIDTTIMVPFEEITRLDKTINDLYHLQYGWSARRDKMDGEWQYEENENNSADMK